MERVNGPDGREWAVCRRWVPHRWDPKLPGRPAFSHHPFTATTWEVLFLIPLVGIVAAAIFLGFAALFAIQFAILLTLIPITLIARVVFRRPWVVQASTDQSPAEARYWHVVGWNRSGEVIAEVSRSLESESEFASVHATPVLIPGREPTASDAPRS